MTNIKNQVHFLVLALCFFVVEPSYAKEILVKLDAPVELIQFYPGGIMFGLRYSDGVYNSSVLFSTAEMRSGITSKSVSIDETKQIQSCEYRWGFLANPPNLPRLDRPEFLVDGFIVNSCTINSSNEIILSLGDYEYLSLEFTAPADALEKRKADFASFTFDVMDRNPNMNYRRLSLDIQDPAKLPLQKQARVVAKKGSLFETQTTWILKDGQVIQDIDTTQSTNFIIK